MGITDNHIIEGNTTWLCTSLFCDKSSWPVILNNGISYFLKQIDKAGYLTSYLLEFNELNGENIRFSIEVSKNRAEQIAKEMDVFFNAFFLDAITGQDDEISSHLKVGELFMPFPQNTIQYGLYNYLPGNDCEDKHHALNVMLSSIIIDVLKDEENLNDEIILTFAFYLNLLLVKLIMDQECMPIAGLIDFYNNWGNKTNENINRSALTGSEETEDLMFEIAKSVFNPLQVGDIPEWLDKWGASIKKELTYSKTPKEEIHSTTVYVIYSQLGINKYIRLLNFHFIHQVLLSELT
ncbi:MAG TPA: hypothetical protein VL490_08760 [Mucilaginibacter sp.]|jgi:hypothetical protein|nr:hypothetical protein [Mucilaginibacter sp.]